MTKTIPSHLRNLYRETYVPYITKSRAGIAYTHYKKLLVKVEYQVTR